MPVQTGETPGTSDALTVESAAEVFAGLLSREENTQTERETPKPEKAEGSEPVANKGEVTEEAKPKGEAPSDEKPEEPGQPQTYTVKIDGKEEAVTLDELLKGYSRTGDYTRKTQQHAEERKAFATEQQAVRAERQTIADNLKRLEETLKEITPQEPDWDKLRVEHPDQFADTWAAWAQHKQRMADIARQREEADKKVAADREAVFKSFVAAEHDRLLEAIPDWKDAEKAAAEKAKLTQYGQSIGFTPDELGSIVDHRAVVALRKAMLYDEAQKAKPPIQNRTPNTPKAATPGTATNKTKGTDLTKAKQRLAQTGRTEDAVAVFSEMFDAEASNRR